MSKNKKKIIRDQAHFFTSPEIPEVYMPDSSLNIDEQILSTINFMTSEIPLENLGDSLKADVERRGTDAVMPVNYSQDELANLLVSIFSSEEKLGEFLFYDLLKYENTSTFKKYLSRYKGLTASAKKKKTGLKCVELLYYPSCFIKDSILVLGTEHRENIGDIINMSHDELANHEYVKHMQINLMKFLIERNKTFTDISRNLSYKIVDCDDPFHLEVQDFFSDEKSHDFDETAARFFFGFLTAHIGYFKKPQFGKWHDLFSRNSWMSTSEVIERGLIKEFVDYSDQEIVADLRLQMEAEALQFKRLVGLYDSQEDCIVNLQRKESQYEKSSQEQRRVLKERKEIIEEQKRRIKDLETEVRALHKSVQNKAIGNEQKLKQQFEQKYDGLGKKYDDLSKSFSHLQGKADEYTERIQDLESSLGQVSRDLTFKNEALVIANDRIAELSRETACVNYSPQILSDDNPDFLKYRKQAELEIKRNTSGGGKIAVMPKERFKLPYDAAKKMCSQLDALYKFESGNNAYIAMYTLINNQPFVFWEGTHKQYMETFTNHKGDRF